MSGISYTEELRIEAVKQVTELGYKVSKVAKRLVSHKKPESWHGPGEI